jgi:hypothetical protein
MSTTTDRHSDQRSLPKTRSGIDGLNEITQGGLPQGRPTLACSSAGCGKTLLGVEFLPRGATQYDEPGVFMAFKETAIESLVAGLSNRATSGGCPTEQTEVGVSSRMDTRLLLRDIELGGERNRGIAQQKAQEEQIAQGRLAMAHSRKSDTDGGGNPSSSTTRFTTR